MDRLTEKQRSYCMSKIRSRDTKPEKIMLERLRGFEYQPKAFGNPDFIDWKKKTVVFIDGCFWHKCPKHFAEPKSNRKYWLPKINGNVLRDREITLAYQKAGWKVKRIWEHQINNFYKSYIPHLPMGDNVISAILNIFSFKNNNLKNYASKSLIRVNAVGEQLEFYVKDALSNSFSLSAQQKPVNYSKVFAWLGNQNHPPDAIIKNGDAFEIKKIEGDSSHLALNSSHPKDVLHNDDERITADCKKCDGGNWKEKDLFYVVGQAKAGVLGYLFLVQGNCYCAKRDVYEKIHEPLKKEITKLLESKGLEQGDTVELGKVKKADPLGITELRIRGMWQIQNPTKVFSNLCSIDKQKKFNLITIIRKDKYESYPQGDIKKLEGTKGILVKDIKIREPNNPSKLIDAKLISFSF